MLTSYIIICMKKRCEWCLGDPLYVEYHDKDWGAPVHDDRLLFEMLILEGAQAGLSWLTILKKRENYRRAFDGFNITKIARYTQKDVRRLLADSGIVRNRLKISAAIENAKAAIKVKEQYGSLDKFLWKHVNGKPIRNSRRTMKDLPARTEESDMMSKDLKAHGFRFVGSTICYAFMQSVGMVNDHITSCFRYRQLK